MEQTLKQLLISFLAPINVHPSIQTKKSKIKQLIFELHPISPGMEMVRLGPKGDGGYLVPNDLSGIEACFSPGVSYISEFEKDCAELGMEVFLADKSVDGPTVNHERFNFTKKYIGAITSNDFMTLDDWVASSLPSSNADLLLQMDIEGYEYSSFLCISEQLMHRCRIIVAEFHDLHMLWSKPFFQIASHAFEKILQTHVCVHIHPNNAGGLWRKKGIEIPNYLEFSFLRKDRIISSSFSHAFPHPLDSDNTGKPSVHLPQCWYRQK